MTEPPPPNATPPSVRRRTEAARLLGSPDDGAIPRMETVRITAPDLVRRAALERTRQRLVFAAGGFSLLFGAVAAKLTYATILYPMATSPAASRPVIPPEPVAEAPDAPPTIADVKKVRATIFDRNGQILAISLPTAALFANPKEMIDPADVAHKLKQVLPRLDEKLARRAPDRGKGIRLSRAPDHACRGNRDQRPRHSRHLFRIRSKTPLSSWAVSRRRCWAALTWIATASPAWSAPSTSGWKTAANRCALSIDVRVQAVMRDELEKSKEEFQAIGACGIVMDVNTGEVIAMVSLPDYDANQFGETPPDDRFNRAVTGMFEPGSTFKLQTAAMALDFGSAHIWDEFDAAHNIHIGRFTITDFKGKHRMLYLPEVLAYSSNLGAAHIALGVGRATATFRGSAPWAC